MAIDKAGGGPEDGAGYWLQPDNPRIKHNARVPPERNFDDGFGVG